MNTRREEHPAGISRQGSAERSHCAFRVLQLSLRDLAPDGVVVEDRRRLLRDRALRELLSPGVLAPVAKVDRQVVERGDIERIDLEQGLVRRDDSGPVRLGPVLVIAGDRQVPLRFAQPVLCS
jgi:hypothetical protein